jgi:hypothetical protein
MSGTLCIGNGTSGSKLGRPTDGVWWSFLNAYCGDDSSTIGEGLDVTLCSLIPSMTFGGYRMFVFLMQMECFVNC